MGAWQRMVNAPCNQPFGNPNPGGPHPGCDYAAPAGTPIVAPSNGQVIVAGQAWDGGFGYHPVAIYHPDDNVTTLVGHMQAHTVSAGQWVNAGDQIGECGSQGFSTGPHAHCELRDGKVAYGNYYNSKDIDAWYYAKGAYGQAVEHQNPSPLGWADRMKIGAMQKILGGLKVDFAWGGLTDARLKQVRDANFGKSNGDPLVKELQHLWGVQPESGNWLQLTDQAYNVWRWCYLNK